MATETSIKEKQRVTLEKKFRYGSIYAFLNGENA